MPKITGDAGANVIAPSRSALTLVSTSASGGVTNGGSVLLAVSPDGNKLLISSSASNLSPLDLNGAETDLFVKDLITGQVTLISRSPAGFQFETSSGGFAADSASVLFASFSDRIGLQVNDKQIDSFRFDLTTGNITQVSVTAAGDDIDRNTSFLGTTPDGLNLILLSDGTNLGPVDNNGFGDIYFLNIATGGLSLQTTNSDGVQGNQHSFYGVVSPDGSILAFQSLASNMVAGDTNNAADIFLKDLVSGVVTRVSTNSAGEESNRSVSNNTALQFSADGTRLLFSSMASNLVAGDTNETLDLFIKDLVTGAVSLVSSSLGGLVGNGASGSGRLSPDGTKVVFVSNSTNLAADDIDSSPDIYLKDLVSGEVTLLSVDVQGQHVTGVYSGPRFSTDGQTVYFNATTPLLGKDTNGGFDVYAVYLPMLGVDTNQSWTIDAGGGDDVVTGGGLADTLSGEDGNDSLWGEAGNDKLYGGAGNDSLNGGDGADRLDGGQGYDTLSGGGGNDYLDGGANGDALSGGDGNDVYIVDNVNDVVSELAGQGYDVVRASVSHTLAANVEALEIQGTANYRGTGNAEANRITGNSGLNTLEGNAGGDVLDGGGGADILIGGTGNDTLTGGTGADTFVVGQESIVLSTVGGTLEVDYITDVIKAQKDKLDLSSIDANSGLAGDQAFNLVAIFGKHAGEMTLAYTAASNSTILRLDVDGDGKADYQMRIDGDVRFDSGTWIL